MSAAIPTSSSSQDVPPASPSPEIPRDSGPDLIPTLITTAELEIVAETKPDESVTSLPRAPRPQSPVQPPDLVHRPARVESHEPDPAPALRTVTVRPHPALNVSLIDERDRPLPTPPPNTTLDASLRSRVVSDPGNVHAHSRSRSRRSEPPPAQPLDLPGSMVIRQRPAAFPADFGSPVRSWGRPSQVRPLAPAFIASCGYHVALA